MISLPALYLGSPLMVMLQVFSALPGIVIPPVPSVRASLPSILISVPSAKRCSVTLSGRLPAAFSSSTQVFWISRSVVSEAYVLTTLIPSTVVIYPSTGSCSRNQLIPPPSAAFGILSNVNVTFQPSEALTVFLMFGISSPF